MTRPEAAAPLLLILLPILVKLPLILGHWHADPLLLHTRIAMDLVPGWAGRYPPYPTIDPNMGVTSLALGHRAALDVLAGHMPWWNPFEGAGVPLAGEMQSAALFPPTLLLALPNGQLYEHIALQIIAGLSAFYLFRRLALHPLAAFGGAAVFAFNGVFAWLGNAVVNPVPFLPMLLLGVETAAARATTGRGGGGTWVTLGVAGSLYAGFPEVAYLDGLLAAAWTLARAGTLPRGRRLVFLGKVVLAGGAALLIAAPILIAFADYLRVAELGGHNTSLFTGQHLLPADLPLVALPYLRGTIFSDPAQTRFWSNVGGYGGCCLLILAFAGLFGGRQRALRVLLASWVVVTLGMIYGAPWLPWITRAVPGFALIPLYRYLPASCIMCLCGLAAFALDDLCTDGRRRRVGLGLLLFVASGIVVQTLPATRITTITPMAGPFSIVLAATCLLLLCGIAAWGRLKRTGRAAGLAAVMLGEAVALFAVPTLQWPRRGAVDIAAIAFLRDHVGLQRFATLGPLVPNFGAYYGIASINYDDLPVPHDWVAFVHDRLDGNSVSYIFKDEARVDPQGPSMLRALLDNRAAYAATGVRYVVSRGDLEVEGLPEVFRDPVVRIYELEGAAPYAAAEGCRLEVRDRLNMRAMCDAPATLVRLEMAMPGWRATVAGAEVPVVTTGGVFQSVALPAGRSDVTFRFTPPFMPWGYAGFCVGMVVLLSGLRPRAPGRA